MTCCAKSARLVTLARRARIILACADGTDSKTIDVTINGSNDGATISGSAAGAVTEDGTLTTGGTLSVADVDSGENVFQAVAAGDLAGSYGSFTFDETSGAWTYALNNAAANVQALTATDVVHDTLTVTSAGLLSTVPHTLTMWLPR